MTGKKNINKNPNSAAIVNMVSIVRTMFYDANVNSHCTKNRFFFAHFSWFSRTGSAFARSFYTFFGFASFSHSIPFPPLLSYRVDFATHTFALSEFALISVLL